MNNQQAVIETYEAVRIIASAAEISQFQASQAATQTKAGGEANGVEGVGVSKGQTVDNLINGATENTNGVGVARNFEKTGGFSETLNDFESLNPTNVKGIQTQYGPGKVGTLPDEGTVVARPGSNTGGATLEINISNSKVYKIRY